MKKKILLLTLILALVGCAPKDDGLHRYSNSSITSGFDTTMTLLAYTKDENEFNDYFELMKDTFWEYHVLFDKYNNYENVNNLKTINDQAGISAVEVDPIIIDLLLIAKEYTEISDYFDITYGAVFSVWHDYREEGIELNAEGKPGKVPSLEELERARELTGWENVEIDQSNNTVFLTKKGVQLDVGAIAKGYATEKVAQKLEEAGLKHAIVSGGGNIRTINQRPDGPWQIGIQEPSLAIDSPSVDVFAVDSSYSVVTSGDYQRTYLGPDQTPYSHLINPNTLFPETHFRSVTVMTKDSTLSDILSTSLFMMDYESGVSFINHFNKNNPDNHVSAVWIVDDNEAWYHADNFDYMITDDLIPLSRNLNQESD